MPDDRRISELTTAEQTSASDLFETAIPNTLSSTGFVSKKNSLATLATFMANTLAFTNLLDTQAKTLIGAINECFASSGGASVAMGTTDPSSASGSDGDLYIKYDSTSYAVLGFWVKINNAWRTISTGGGTAFVEITQADYNQLSYADKHSNIPYLITDGVLPAIEAADVTYDNTGSTLSADDVNEAIDELDAEKMNHIDSLSTASVASTDKIAFSDGTNEYKAAISDVGAVINAATTGTITPNSGYAVRGTPTVKKVNNTVYLHFNINATTAFNSRKTIGNISSGFRPSGTIGFIVPASTGINDLNNITTSLLVASNGDIIVGDLVLPSNLNIKEVCAYVSYSI